MTLKNGMGKCSSFVLSASGWKDQITWTPRFAAKENPNEEKALFDLPIVLQYDFKAKFCLISRNLFGLEDFSAERSLNQPKATPRLYPFGKPNKSLYFRSSVVSVLFARFHFKVMRKSLYRKVFSLV